MSDGMTDMYKADRVQHDCPIPDQCMNCNPANIEDLVEMTLGEPVIDLDQPVTAPDLRLEGFNGSALRIDLVEQKLYLATALTRRLVLENFYANKTLRIGVAVNDQTIYFLELTLDARGFQIEDMEAVSLGDIIELELVAEIASHRYLSAETVG